LFTLAMLYQRLLGGTTPPRGGALFNRPIRTEQQVSTTARQCAACGTTTTILLHTHTATTTYTRCPHCATSLPPQRDDHPGGCPPVLAASSLAASSLAVSSSLSLSHFGNRVTPFSLWAAEASTAARQRQRHKKRQRQRDRQHGRAKEGATGGAPSRVSGKGSQWRGVDKENGGAALRRRFAALDPTTVASFEARAANANRQGGKGLALPRGDSVFASAFPASPLQQR